MADDRNWMDEAEEALQRTTDALKAAWESSREQRMSALAAAKEAAEFLGRAIDEGADVARRTWDEADGAPEAAAAEPTPADGDLQREPNEVHASPRGSLEHEREQAEGIEVFEDPDATIDRTAIQQGSPGHELIEDPDLDADATEVEGRGKG